MTVEIPPPQEPAVIREWDRSAVADFAMPSVLLMENAGNGAARILRELSASRELGGPWIVLCGPGNNGGDGFVMARHLHNAGEEVEVHLAFDPERLEDGRDNTVNYRILERTRVPIHGTGAPFPPPEVLRDAAAGTVVDALLGTGLSRPLRSPYLEWVRAVNDCDLPVVAVDVPSGLDASSGEVLGEAVHARHTITFAASKVGFGRGEGQACAGTVHVLDIGMPREIWESAGRAVD